MANINIESLDAPLYFGSGANRTKINIDGEIELEGTARVVHEIEFSLLGAKLDLPAGKVSYDYDENCLIFNPSGNIGTQADRVIGNLLLRHDVDLTEGLTPVVRYKQTTSNNTEFKMQFRIQAGGDAPESTWTEITADYTSNATFTYTSSDIVQEIRFATIPITHAHGSIIQGRMTRSDANTGDIDACFIGLEYIKNTLGG